MRKTKKILPIFLSILLIFSFCSGINGIKVDGSEKVLTPTVITASSTYEAIEIVKFENPVKESITEEDMELLALITMAEAEGEPEEGKRLVIDTILNRVDSAYFPDTIHDVIYQPNQFSPMWNGRINRCEVREDICQLIREELASRSNYKVLFFNANNYSNYGDPLFQVGNHYFSSYH